MATTQKAINLLEAVASELAFRLPALAQTKGFDGSVDKNPTLLVGAAAAGSAGAFILIKPMDWTSKDVLGNAGQRFAPHVIQVVLEANPAGGAGADVNSLAIVSTLIAVLARKGARVEVYQETNGSAVGEADIVASKLVATLDMEVDKGMIANV